MVDLDKFEQYSNQTMATIRRLVWHRDWSNSEFLAMGQSGAKQLNDIYRCFQVAGRAVQHKECRASDVADFSPTCWKMMAIFGEDEYEDGRYIAATAHEAALRMLYDSLLQAFPPYAEAGADWSAGDEIMFHEHEVHRLLARMEREQAILIPVPKGQPPAFDTRPRPLTLTYDELSLLTADDDGGPALGADRIRNVLSDDKGFDPPKGKRGRHVTFLFDVIEPWFNHDDRPFSAKIPATRAEAESKLRAMNRLQQRMADALKEKRTDDERRRRAIT